MSGRSSSALVVAGAVLLAVACVGLVAAEEYPIDAPGAIETPEETVTIENLEFTVDSVLQVDPGDSISVQVDGPDSYNVELYNSDEQIEDVSRGSGSESHSFTETEEYGVGSYAVTVEVDGLHKAAQPVVVAGYDVSLEYPPTFDLGDDELEVTLMIEETAAEGPPPNEGEVALWNEGETIRVPAEHVEGDEYEATVPAGDLEEGTYDIYGGAQGEMTSQGEFEALGVSDRHQVEVTDDDDGGLQPPGGDDDGENGNGDDDGADDSNGDDDGNGDGDGADDSNGDDDGNGDNGSNGDDDGDDAIQEPVDDIESDDEADDDGIPLGVVPVMVAIVAAAGVLAYARTL